MFKCFGRSISYLGINIKEKRNYQKLETLNKTSNYKFMKLDILFI